MDNILEVQGLSKQFKGFSLKDVSFNLPRGYIMGFIGPNGAGKTTTIKLLLNMLHRDKGDIRIFGLDNIQRETDIKERIGVVMDNPYYVEDWRLKDVEQALKPFYQKWSSQTFAALLQRFELDKQKKVKELSRGMKMKLMIAAALSHEAELLILDEPTSGLDAVVRDELMDILLEFVGDENRGVLFSTHITSDLERIADYITFIAAGRVVISDLKDNLMEHYFVVKGGLMTLDAEQKKHIIGYREHSVGFEGLVDMQYLPKLHKDILVEKSTLDDLVIHFNLEGKKHDA